MKKYLVVMMAILVSGSAFALKSGDELEGISSDRTSCILHFGDVSDNAIEVSYLNVSPRGYGNYQRRSVNFQFVTGPYAVDGRNKVLLYSAPTKDGVQMELLKDVDTGKVLRLTITTGSGSGTSRYGCSVFKPRN